MTHSRIQTPMLAILALLLVSGNINDRMISLDTAPPHLSITSRSTTRIENYTGTSISLGGIASDDLQIANVTWYTDRGAQGTCAGIGNWIAGNVPLLPGENLITIAATDLAGNVGVDCITVVCVANIDIKIVSPTKVVVPGQTMDISVVCTNIGNTDAKNVTIKVWLPSGMQYISGGTWNASDQTISWIVNCLHSRQCETRIFRTQVK